MKDQVGTMPYKNLFSCVGREASETIQHLILHFPQIQKVTFASYSHLPMVQKRMRPSYPEMEIIKHALAMREEHHLPFWDCVMLLISNSASPAFSLLDTAATHVSLRDSYAQLDRAAIKHNAIRELIAANALKSKETCVTSEVVVSDGTTRHLAMMDFHCRPTEAGRLAATAVCRKIFPAGALLLESGESFHAYGLELLSTSQFYEFLGRSLLYSPIIDRAYIAHQLIEQRCALRISGVIKTNPKTLALTSDE